MGKHQFMNNLKYLVVLLLLVLSPLVHAQEPYRLNPGDVLGISVWNEEDLQQEVLVLPDGTISFPLVGIVKVSDKTPEQVQSDLKEKLSRLIPDPEINVTVNSLEGNSIFIIGKVNDPGTFLLTRPTDVVQALSLAGGFTPYAETEKIQILRRNGEQQVVIKFNYEKVAAGKALASNVLLQSGDTIVVP
jgi:polysaccharide export outer membrane protein